MKPLSFGRAKLYVLTTLLWACFVGLSWRYADPLGLLNIVGFGTVMVVPGLLTWLGLSAQALDQKASPHRRSRQAKKSARRTKKPVRPERRLAPSAALMSRLRYAPSKPSADFTQRLYDRTVLPFWFGFGIVLGFSILELLVWGLLCNTLLPHLHVPRPLDRRPLLVELSVLYVGTAVWAWPRLKGVRYRLDGRHIGKTGADMVLALVPLLFVVLSCFGATSLNNGGTDIWTLAMLIGMGLYICVILRMRPHNNTVAWTIYLMALALLLSTSLRGWYTSGHDVELEYRVFELAKHHGVWNISDFRDPFNACLSITILPTMLANTLHVGDPYVYKIYFQLLFAATPAVLYVFIRRYLLWWQAFLAAVYFIAFPTFFTDMPMLNRQEIAFLFLSLMLLVVFDPRLKAARRRLLFIVFGGGMVLSHYSTTYAMVFILLTMLATRPVFAFLWSRLQRWRLFGRTGIAADTRPRITATMVILIALFCFAWNVVLTNTSTAGNVLSTTMHTITSGLNEDNKSSAAAYSVLSGGEATPQQELIAYQKLTVDPARAHTHRQTFYPESIVKAYPLRVAKAANVPLTTIGRKLKQLHVSPGKVNDMLKQGMAQLIQLLVVAGIVYVLFRRRLAAQVEVDFLLLSFGCLLFLALQVLLPYLSVAYGLLRAFQQSLLVLGLFVVVGSGVLSAWATSKWLRHGVPIAIGVAFFFISTGTLSQLIGGYLPQFNLDNSGQYYDVYYLHKSEVVASYWLLSQVQRQDSDVQADPSTSAKLRSLTGIVSAGDITPGLILQDSYVFLGYTNTVHDQAEVPFNSDIITYQYPAQFLNETKNLVYSNDQARIYR